MNANSGLFHADDLVLVPPPARPVVLGSGGPIMELESVEDGVALCSWTADDGRLCRSRFPLPCLYACVPVPAEWSSDQGAA